MAEVRACVYIFVIVLCFQITIAKPFFGDLACLLLCDDEDTSPVDPDDYLDVWCNDCPTAAPRPTTTTMPPAALNAMPPFPGQGPFPNRGQFSFTIPNGVNVSMVPDPMYGYNWILRPWNSPGGPAATPTGSTPPAAPTVTTTTGSSTSVATTEGTTTTAAPGK